MCHRLLWWLYHLSSPLSVYIRSRQHTHYIVSATCVLHRNEITQPLQSSFTRPLPRTELMSVTTGNGWVGVGDNGIKSPCPWPLGFYLVLTVCLSTIVNLVQILLLFLLLLGIEIKVGGRILFILPWSLIWYCWSVTKVSSEKSNAPQPPGRICQLNSWTVQSWITTQTHSGGSKHCRDWCRTDLCCW